MTPNLDLGYTRLILETAEAEKCFLEEKAYILATSYWETNRTMEPVEEAYYLGEPRASRYREKLWYYPWYGRGFAQITHEKNYLKNGKRLGLDLTTDPSAVMNPEVAAKILVVGSREGLFTGRRLSHYLKPGVPDYVGARRVINGTDCAAEIALIAKEYEMVLAPAPAYPNVRLGSTGATVARLQRALADRSYLIHVDGRFGPQTDRVVRAAQKAAGLKEDGIVGPKTWAALLPLNEQEKV